jgi:hypothetical protein
MINQIITKSEIIEIIKQIQTLISSCIRKTDKSNEAEELTENLFIIITKSANYLAKDDTLESWEKIVENLKFINMLKPKMKEYPSITNKIIFKHMDIVEEISSSSS